MTKEELMRRAIELSENSVRNGGGPFGAVIAKDGEIIAEGSNKVTINNALLPMQRFVRYVMHARY